MTITRPSLKLEFADEGDTVICGTYDILANSITVHRRLLSDLKSASDMVTLSLDRWSAAVQRLVSTDEPVMAVLSSNGRTIFTGYVSTDFSWAVTDTGRQTLDITIEDVGTRLLSAEFIETGRHLFDCDVMAAVDGIVERCGIRMSYNQPQSKGIRVTHTVEAGEVCRDILTNMLYEAGMCFSFDEDGCLRVHDLGWDEKDAVTVDRYSIALVGSSAIALSKRIRQYRGARVTYTGLGRASDYLVYRNTTGQDTGHPYCNLEMDGRTVFDGTRIYSSSEWEDLQDDDYTGPALIEAVNASSEQETVASGKIISISDPVLTLTSLSYIYRSIRAEGGPYFSLVVENRSSMSASVTRLDVTADIIYEKETNILLSSTEGYVGGDMLEETLTWVHDREAASRHANLVAQYHRHAGCVYTFYTFADVTAGSVVRLVDDVHSGLSTLVLVVATTETDQSDVISCEAVGLGPFDLSAPLHFQTVGYAGRAPLPVDDPEEEKPQPTLEVSADRGSVTWYADDIPVDPDEEILVSFTKTDTAEPVIVSYADSRHVYNTGTGTHPVRSSEFEGRDTLVVTVTCGVLQRSVTLVKVHLVGSLRLTLSAPSFAWYADDVPHDPDDEIEIVCAQEGYGQDATLNIQGLGIVAEGTASFTVKSGDMGRLDSMLVQYGIAGVRMESAIIAKAKDIGVLELMTSATSFSYTADNWPVDETERILVTVHSSGYSRKPALKLAGLPVALSEEGTHEIAALDLLDHATLQLEAICHDQVRQTVITKVRQSASISLFLSRSAVKYYADGVECPDQDVEARVMHSGLHYGVHLVAGGRFIEPDADGTYHLPSGLLDDSNEVAVKAEGARLVSVADTAVLRKETLVPTLAVFTDAGSFSLDSDGTLSPEAIIVLVQWSGVSGAVRPTLSVNGRGYDLDRDGRFTMPSSFAAGRTGVRIVATLPDFAVTRETYIPVVRSGRDGESVLVEYRWCPSRTTWEDAEGLVGLTMDGVPLTLDGAPIVMDMVRGLRTLTLDGVPLLLDGEPVVVSAQDAADRRLVLAGVPIVLAGQDVTLAPLPGAHLTLSDSIVTLDGTPLSIGAPADGDGGWSTMHSLEAPEGRPYLWMRTSTDGGATWTYSCITGAQGPQGEQGEKGDKGDAGDAGVYLGAHDKAPTSRPDGSSLSMGDYYLDTADTSNPLPFILQENGVWTLVEATDADWSVIASVTQADVASLGTALLVTNSYYGYFSLLAAMNASFDTVHTKTMVVRDGGRIVSRSHLDSGGVEGFEISDEGIYASTGSWNAGINSGTLRCIPNSRLADGRDAFDFRTDVTLGEYWERFKALKVNTNIFLHTPEDFREYYRCIRNGRFDAPMREMKKDLYGVRPFPAGFGTGTAVQDVDSGIPIVMAVLNRRYLAVYTQTLEGTAVSMFINLYDMERLPVQDDMGAPVYDFTIDVTGYGATLWSMLVDDVEGKAYCIFVGRSNEDVLPVYSFPIREEYATAPVLTKEAFTDNLSDVAGGAPITFILQSYDRMYIDGGMKTYLSTLLHSGTEDAIPQRIILFDAKARRIDVKASFECHYDLVKSTAPSVFFYGVQEVAGVMYGLATIPQTGLCIVRIDGDDDLEILRILFDDDEDTWATYPWTLPDKDAGRVPEVPAYCSADMSVHGDRLLICVSRKVKDLAKLIRPWDTASYPFMLYRDDPCIATDSLVGWYDVTTGTFTELELPKARLMPTIHNDDATTKSFYYVSSSNIDGMRPQELSLIPKTLRYNRITGKYDLLGVMMDVALGGVGIMLASETGMAGIPYPSFKLNGFYCRFSADMEFECGTTQRKAGSTDVMTGLMIAEGGAAGGDISFLSRSRDLAGDMYLPQEMPLYYARCDLVISVDGSSETIGIPSVMVWGYRRSQKENRHRLLMRITGMMDERPSDEEVASMLETYERYYAEEPAIGHVIGLRTRYDADDDSYGIEFITDSRMSRYDIQFQTYEASLSTWSEAGFGVENGNGTYSFDRFIPDITLKKGDRTLCPVTVDLHTNAFTYFDN